MAGTGGGAAPVALQRLQALHTGVRAPTSHHLMPTHVFQPATHTTAAYRLAGMAQRRRQQRLDALNAHADAVMAEQAAQQQEHALAAAGGAAPATRLRRTRDSGKAKAGFSQKLGNTGSKIGNKIVSKTGIETDIQNMTTALHNKVASAAAGVAITQEITMGEATFGGNIQLTGMTNGKAAKGNSKKSSKFLDKKMGLQVFESSMRTIALIVVALGVLAGIAALLFMFR